MPETKTENEEVFDEIYNELKTEEAAPPKAEKERSEGFKALPNGKYVGTVYILTKTIDSDQSPNKGRKQYEFQYTVDEGEMTGKMAYRHYVIVPHEVANQPSAAAGKDAMDKWRAAIKANFRKIDSELEKCGVDTKVQDRAQLGQKIAENNRRRTRVSFDVKDGHPYANHALKIEDRENSLLNANAADNSLPDGNDAPLM